MDKLKAFISCILNSLVWELPSSVHTFILAKTGWRLVRTIDDEAGDLAFQWTKKYPLEVEGITASCVL